MELKLAGSNTSPQAVSAVTALVPPAADINAVKKKRRVDFVMRGVIKRGGISRRPYSTYTVRGRENENTPKYDDAKSNREWWRSYIKVSHKID